MIIVALLMLAAYATANAGEVTILAADFRSIDNRHWTVKVTLQHADTGWDHFADNWRVVDDAGNILGERVLYHPHVNEQPFTRSLGNLVIPGDINSVFIIAHDKLHGWSPSRLEVDLTKAVDGHLKAVAQ
jgi:hypothetical protein